MADIQLSKEEWEAAMAFVLASDPAPVENTPSPKPIVVKRMPKGSKVRVVPTKDALCLEIPAGGGWASRVGKPEPKNTNSNEIPNNHPPAAGKSRTPADQPNDPVLPAGGGWASRVGKPEPKNTNSNEIPNNHPPAAGSPRTPIDWAAAAQAAKDAINYGTDTSVGWSIGAPLPKVSESWGKPFPQGNAPASQEPDGKKVTSTQNKAPRSSLASETSDDDGDDDAVSLPDGSFTIHTADDVYNAVAKVQNAEQTNPRQAAGHPWYVEIKRHIAKRAAAVGAGHMVPADWQIMQAQLEDRDFSAGERKGDAKTGEAMPDGSFPIENGKDLHNAIQAVGRAKHPDAAKAHIRKRATALGLSSELPDSWK